ncbi:unnamed protein product [Cylicocyclus nassatus]|uniref:Uncharacterized protein n=1 Tax=Cylicocyclus nassatus TaxID=53992 RepID=A0AA36DRZ9_CYLNA|nr:unnamed protein product [Cylicocyclus nassatus]
MFYLILILLPAFYANDWSDYDCSSDMDGINLLMGFRRFCNESKEPVPTMIYDNFNACYYLENYWLAWKRGTTKQSKKGFAYNYRYYVHPEMKKVNTFNKAKIFAELLSKRPGGNVTEVCQA